MVFHLFGYSITSAGGPSLDLVSSLNSSRKLLTICSYNYGEVLNCMDASILKIPFVLESLGGSCALSPAFSLLGRGAT